MGIPKIIITATRPTKFPSMVCSLWALFAPLRLAAAVNLRYGRKAEKVHCELGGFNGDGRYDWEYCRTLVEDGRPRPSSPKLRGEDLAQLSAQDLAGGRSWQHIHEMDLTGLLVGGETLGYKSAEALF